MSGRRLGGGRILGSGKGLAPPAPPTAPRSDSPLALSESIVSLESPSLSPPATGSLPDLGLDIGSSISVGAQAKDSALGATDLICPICTEEMVTLLQLNRHIDDSHQELPEEEQNEVKTWFDKQVLRAKRFQPLTIIHQKLRGLEAFEANESNFAPPQVKGSGRPSLEGPVDPDELITRSHWQRTTSYNTCTDPACGKKLGTLNGSINCRKCGRLFCEEHTMYQIKLSRSANHEPVRGIWARVCETCYKSREGYNDHTGVSIDHTPSFFEIRRKKIERQRLETARLEKRLTKLTRLLAGLPDNPSASNSSLLGSVSSLIGQKDSRKLLEQSVVPWEEDDVVSKCPFCQQEFGSWIFRRHHCRMCGRVVCADIQTACSSEVSLNVSSGEAAQPHHNPLDLRLLTSEKVTAATTYSEKAQTSGTSDQLCVDVRICRECDHIIFSHRDFAASLAHKPPDQKAYETLHQFERGIRLLLPSFHRVLLALQPEKSSNGEIDLNKPPPTHAQIQEASKIRRRLIDSFGKYGAAAKRMRNLKTDNATQKKLQEAMYTYASGFLHSNLLPLKSVPQILRTKRVVPSGPSPRCLSMNSSGLRFTELADSSDVGSQVPSDETSIVISQLETEEKELKERLAVLQEQRLMINDMISMAKAARRFEEVSALACNGDELDAEIRTLTAKVGDIEIRWEGLYRSGTPT